MKKLGLILTILLTLIILASCSLPQRPGSDKENEKESASISSEKETEEDEDEEEEDSTDTELETDSEDSTESEVETDTESSTEVTDTSTDMVTETETESSTEAATETNTESSTESDADSSADEIVVEYIAWEGGSIKGNMVQNLTLTNGFALTDEVCAVSDEGYVFVGWDDGYEEATRTDYVMGSARFVAIFAKLHTIKFTFNDACGIVVGETQQIIAEGQKTASVFAYPQVGYKFSHWSNGLTDQTISITAEQSEEIEAIFVQEELSLPIISLTTNGDEITKEEYLDCQVTIKNTDEKFTLENAGARIRGRGNSTWEYDKKPYKLKFDVRQNLFGNGYAKDWTLITNHSDLSLSRNYLAQSVASLFDNINETTATQFVELYINGKYLGVYLLCEQIEVQENRVNITENSEIDTGYLIELDGRKDGYGFDLLGKYYVIKDPDTDSELFTEEHEAFIKNYLESCMFALVENDYQKVTELIDVNSFADAYIVYELLKSADAGYSSFFMHKDAGGKLVCGPVWDFDRSLGIVGHSKDAKPYDALWAREQNVWFCTLLEFSEFRELVGEKLIEYAPKIEEKLIECYDYLYENRDSFDRNFEKWRILGTFVWPNDDELTELDTWDLQVEYTRTYLKNSLDFLLETYP